MSVTNDKHSKTNSKNNTSLTTPNIIVASNDSPSCTPLLPDPLLGAAKMPPGIDEEPVLKKSRESIPKCAICKKVGEGVKNRSCELHGNEVRLKTPTINQSQKDTMTWYQ